VQTTPNATFFYFLSISQRFEFQHRVIVNWC